MNASPTATTLGARQHARAQEGTVVEAMPTVPASRWPSPPDGVPAADLTWATVVAAGGYTHRSLARGTHVRLTDLAGDACAHVLLLRADEPWERLNPADTTKVAWQVYTAPGQLLLSDAGRVLATVVEDTSGHHDALFGTTSRARNEARYGDGSAQGPSPAGRELLALAAAKHGLGRRDVGPTVSFFSGVVVGTDGAPRHTGSAGPGAHVLLRAEVPLLLLVANTAHPLDPREAFTCSPLEVLAWRGEPTRPHDALWTATPEGRRAFENTAEHLTAQGIA